MTNKRLHVDGMVFGIADDQVDTVVAQVTAALRDKSVQVIAVLDDHNRRVSLYLNGSTVTSVVIDLDAGPKPHEVS